MICTDSGYADHNPDQNSIYSAGNENEYYGKLLQVTMKKEKRGSQFYTV